MHLEAIMIAMTARILFDKHLSGCGKIGKESRFIFLPLKCWLKNVIKASRDVLFTVNLVNPPFIMEATLIRIVANTVSG